LAAFAWVRLAIRSGEAFRPGKDSKVFTKPRRRETATSSSRVRTYTTRTDFSNMFDTRRGTRLLQTATTVDAALATLTWCATEQCSSQKRRTAVWTLERCRTVRRRWQLRKTT